MTDVYKRQRKGRQEGRRISLATQGVGGQLQPGDPAFGAALQKGNIGRGQAKPHVLVEKCLRFVPGEAEVARAKLIDLLLGAHSPQEQRRIGAADEDQMHVGRQALDEKVGEGVDVARLYEVVVIHNHHKRPAALGDSRQHIVAQRGQHRGAWRDVYKRQGPGGSYYRSSVGRVLHIAFMHTSKY